MLITIIIYVAYCLWIRLSQRGICALRKDTYCNDEQCDISTVNVYFINMDSSRHRLDHMVKQFENCKINSYTRISGVAPSNIGATNMSIYNEVCPNHTGSELGCLYSHLKTLHTAYSNGNKYALVLEDDVIFIRTPIFCTMFETAPFGWEILQLHSLHTSVYRDNHAELWIPFHFLHFSTAAYVINEQGMKSILNKMFKNYSPFTQFEDLILDKEMLSSFPDDVCTADRVLYTFAVTYTCTDLFLTTIAEESTIHSDHIHFHQDAESQTLSYFNSNGFKEPTIGRVILNLPYHR